MFGAFFHDGIDINDLSRAKLFFIDFSLNSLSFMFYYCNHHLTFMLVEYKNF